MPLGPLKNSNFFKSYDFLNLKTVGPNFHHHHHHHHVHQKFWYTISHTSSAQNQMKLCTHLPYVIPQDCFLENSGNSKNLSQKTLFSVNLDLEKFHSRSPMFWYTISHTSIALNQMKHCTRFHYVIPLD